MFSKKRRGQYQPVAGRWTGSLLKYLLRVRSFCAERPGRALRPASQGLSDMLPKLQRSEASSHLSLQLSLCSPRCSHFSGHLVQFSLRVRAQSCPTLCHSMVWSPPGSSICGILHARILECVAIPFSMGSSNPGVEPRPPALQEDSLLSDSPRKPQESSKMIKPCGRSMFF